MKSKSIITCPENSGVIDKPDIKRNENALAALRLGKKSPHQLSIERELEICVWVFRNGFTTELVISILFGTQKDDYCKRLAKRGLLRQNKIPPGWPVNRDYHAKDFYTLTDAGLTLARNHEAEISSYPEIDPWKVRPSTFFHSILFQVETAWRLQRKEISAYKSERMLAVDANAEKRPDGAWADDIFDHTVFRLVEIENRDRKEGVKLARFVSGCMNLIESGKYHGAYILTHTTALLDHYKKQFEPGKPYFKEWVSKKNIWYPVQSSTALIPENIGLLVRHANFAKPQAIRTRQRMYLQDRLERAAEVPQQPVEQID